MTRPSFAADVQRALATDLMSAPDSGWATTALRLVGVRFEGDFPLTWLVACFCCDGVRADLRLQMWIDYDTHEPMDIVGLGLEEPAGRGQQEFVDTVIGEVAELSATDLLPEVRSGKGPGSWPLAEFAGHVAIEVHQERC